MNLRPYQNRALDAIDSAFSEVNSALIVMATGTGKTIVMSALADREIRRGGRVLILAHRAELINQAVDKLQRATGISAGIEMADLCSDTDAETPPYMVVVGSVQSMCRPARLARFHPDDFTLVMIDECHHALADTYRSVVSHFSGAKLLGVTATPDRGDLRSLGEVFEKIAFEYSIVEAIKDGYLSPVRAQTIPLKIDISGVAKQNGDYQASGLGSALAPYLHQICVEILQRAADRKTVVFTPLIATSRLMLDKFAELGAADRVREVNGESKDRKETLEWFDNAPKGSIILNSMLLCLDTKTEILTDKGFVGINEISMKHKVANWNFDGSVFFEEPKEIVKRPLEKGKEYMVHVHSQCHDIRVTSTHKMIISCGAHQSKWKKIPASDFKANDSYPVCGIAEPFSFTIPQEKRNRKKFAISGTAYNIRKSYPGTSLEESKRLAIIKMRERDLMRYKNPDELSLDECRFIGFWLADGSMNILKRGGREYTLAQSMAYPRIIEWIDMLIERLNYHTLKKIMPPTSKTKHKSIRWSLPRGTGGGVQKRNGLYSIEPYLIKGGVDLFWGLNEKQFDALIEGFGYGDGNHGKAENGFPRSVYMNNTSKVLIDLLCAIGSVRGWCCRTSIIPQKNQNHKIQYGLKMIKGAARRTVTSKAKIIHEDYKPESVWCVRTTSKNIITRRNGRIAIMGNTEGWDSPSADCICVLRATRSRGLYVQMVGRGTRLCEGKENLLLLDFLWMTQSHDLCRPAVLLSNDDEVCEMITKKQEKAAGVEDIELTPETLEEAESDTVKKRHDALAKKLEEQRRKKGNLVDPLQYAYSISDINLTNYTPLTDRDAASPTMEQINRLEQLGFGCPDSFGAAELLVKTAEERHSKGMAAPKEIRLLERRHFKNVAQWTHEQASKMIRRLVANGWRTPYGINPKTYKPE